MKLSDTEKKEGLNAVQQIAAVVHHASNENLRVRAVGTGSSWSKLTNVRDILIGKLMIGLSENDLIVLSPVKLQYD